MIEVLKQMTEALEDITRLLQGITGGTFSKLDAAIQAGCQAIAELELQEPVACDCNQGQVCHICDPITPPQRTWVGLTDDEIINVIHPLVMADMPDVATDYEIAKAIEAKLKELNT